MTDTVVGSAWRGWRPAIAALLIPLAAAIVGCGGVENPVVLGTEPFDRAVTVEDDLAALETWVDSKQKADVLLHVDAMDDIEIVPQALEESMKNAADHLKHGNTRVIYDIANFLETSGTLGLGRRAGLYDRVVWIFPSRRPIAELGLDAFKGFLIGARGYRQSDLSDLAIVGNRIEGTIGGVPLTITNIEDFDPGGATAIVDIDLSYFTSMQAQNPGYMLGTASLLEFLDTLKDKGISARFATINLSSKGRIVPIGIRYMGDLILESLGNPETLVERPDKWKRMIDAESLVGEERFRAADSLYESLVKDYPDDAGLQYMRGAVLALLGWGRESGRYLTNACKIDQAYRDGFFQVANLVASRGSMEVAESLVQAPILKESYRLGELNYNIGVMYVRSGMPEKALPYLVGAMTFQADNIDLVLLVYRTARDAGSEEEMLSALERLVELDRQLVRSKMPWVFRELGILYEMRGEVGKAERMYLLYIEAAPGDSAAVELQKQHGGKKRLD